jgi:flagellar motor switch/type III secretory pathway protein FliN
MIAHARFVPGVDGVRRLRFSARSSIPLDTACLVANGLRETLRDVFDDACELVVGEPCAITADAWRVLTTDALLFVTSGRQTDIVLVIGRADARRLVLRAFGEGAAPSSSPIGSEDACSALEVQAIERIAARCAMSFDALCAQRSGPSRAVAFADVPSCAAYFDVRVHAPVALTLGIAIVRALPEPGPAGRLAPRTLDDVPIALDVTLASTSIAAAEMLGWQIGDVVAFPSRLGADAMLRAGGRVIACGVPGVAGSHAALRVTGSLAVADARVA